MPLSALRRAYRSNVFITSILTALRRDKGLEFGFTLDVEQDVTATMPHVFGLGFDISTTLITDTPAALTAPSIRSAGAVNKITTTGSTATFIVQPPGTYSAGDLIVTWLAIAKLGAVVTPPAGDTRVTGSPFKHGTNEIYLDVFVRTATGSETEKSYGVASISTSRGIHGQAIAIRDHNGLGLGGTLWRSVVNPPSQTAIGPIPGVAVTEREMVLLFAMREKVMTGIGAASGDSLTWTELTESIDSASASGKTGFSLNYAVNDDTPRTIADKTLTVAGGTATSHQIGLMLVVKPAESGAVAAPTISFSASDDTITSGQSTNLLWTTTGAVSGSIDGIGALSPLAGGSVSVSPTVTTTYTARVANSQGLERLASVTITVDPGVADDPTVQLSASPGTINAGQSSTLNWQTTNATTGNINQGVGAMTPIGAGNRAAAPTATTTYTATVQNAAGETAQAATTVTVGGGSGLPLWLPRASNYRLLESWGICVSFWDSRCDPDMTNPAYVLKMVDYVSGGTHGFRLLRQRSTNDPNLSPQTLAHDRTIACDAAAVAAGRPIRWLIHRFKSVWTNPASINAWVDKIVEFNTDLGGRIKYVEGPNEPYVTDQTYTPAGQGTLSGPGGSDGCHQAIEAAMHDFYDEVNSRAALNSVTVIHNTSEDALRASPPHTTPFNDSDLYCTHPYPKAGTGAGRTPPVHMPEYIRTRYQGSFAGYNRNQPLAFTETGFHDKQNTTAGGWWGADSATNAIWEQVSLFEVMMLGTSLAAGVPIYCKYDLVDRGSNPTSDSSEQSFGLFYTNPNVTTLVNPAVTPKISATALRNLCIILDDDEPNFQPAGLNYRIDGLPATGRHGLVQHSNGHWFIIIWNLAQNWTKTTSAPGSAVAVASNPLTLVVPAGRQVLWYCPQDGTAPTATPTLTKKPLIAEVF